MHFEKGAGDDVADSVFGVVLGGHHHLADVEIIKNERLCKYFIYGMGMAR